MTTTEILPPWGRWIAGEAGETEGARSVARAAQSPGQLFRRRRHLGPGDLEPGVVAEIGIGHGLALAAGHVVEQQAEFGDGAAFVVPGGDPAQISQVVVVQGDDVGEAAEVGRRHLPALIAGDIDPMFARHGLGARIGRMADMPVPRAGGLDDQVEPQALGLGAEGGLGEGGATDVAEADEEDGGHGEPLSVPGLVFRNHLIGRF